jgi:hypothetical protein
VSDSQHVKPPLFSFRNALIYLAYCGSLAVTHSTFMCYGPVYSMCIRNCHALIIGSADTTPASVHSNPTLLHRHGCRHGGLARPTSKGDYISPQSKDSQRRLAICSVKLSMYICRVAFPDNSLSVSLSTALTRSRSTAGWRRLNEYHSLRES